MTLIRWPTVHWRFRNCSVNGRFRKNCKRAVTLKAASRRKSIRAFETRAWNTGWIPFAGNGGGDLYCIDMAPAEGGTVGQIISHNHESFDHKLLARSFGDYLESLAERLENGELTFSEKWGVCVPI